MTVPLTREVITVLNAGKDPAANLRWIAANLSPADQAKLQTISRLPADQALRWIAANVPATPPKTPASPPVRVNEAGYAQQKADVNQQYGAQIAASDYGRTIAQQRHSRETGDFGINQQRQRESFDDPYLRRGLFNSGIRQRGLIDLRGDQARAAGALAERQQGELGTIAMQRAQLLTGQQGALNAVDRARQAAIFNQLGQLGG